MLTDAEIIAAAKQAVCQVFQIPTSAMTSQRRHASVVWPRQLAIRLAYEQTGDMTGSQQVATAFAKIDHGTVLYAVKTVKDRLESKDSEAIRQWNKCVAEFYAIMDGSAEFESLVENHSDIAVAATG